MYITVAVSAFSMSFRSAGHSRIGNNYRCCFQWWCNHHLSCDYQSWDNDQRLYYCRSRVDGPLQRLRILSEFTTPSEMSAAPETRRSGKPLPKMRTSSVLEITPSASNSQDLPDLDIDTFHDLLIPDQISNISDDFVNAGTPDVFIQSFKDFFDRYFWMKNQKLHT